MPRLLLFNKPYGVLSQFTDQADRETLAQHIELKRLYPAGRLDRDSEGLLLLTDDGPLQHRISDPQHKLAKTYWVQVEGIPDETALEALRQGVELKDGITAPATVRSMDAPGVWERDPPVRFRAAIPTSWIEISVSEGRNRQVRRMTAAVGYPTLRLIRYAIGNWTLDSLAPGQWREVEIPTELLHPLQGRKQTPYPHRNTATGKGHRANAAPANSKRKPGQQSRKKTKQRHRS